MSLTLTNFEGLIEAKIVERGYDYYKSGRVSKVEQIGAGEFSAAAFGTDKYEIYIKTVGDKIVEYECDCPYDWGDTCKHAVAVFYHLRDGNFTDTGGKLSEILDNLHADALRRFVSNMLKKDQSFRRKFLREFDEDFEDDEDDEFFDRDYY